LKEIKIQFWNYFLSIFICKISSKFLADEHVCNLGNIQLFIFHILIGCCRYFLRTITVKSMSNNIPEHITVWYVK